MEKIEHVYIHFPFCQSKCHYCDFFSSAGHSPGDPALFLEALAHEITIYRTVLAPQLKTLYLGGGTPSFLDPALLSVPLKGILEHLSPETEFTIEANPQSLTENHLELYRDLGVNRLSLGIQSLQDEDLRWLGRAHDAAQALSCLESVSKSGWDNLSVDVLCGLPDQNLTSLKTTLDALLQFPITHLSCYLLSLHEGHPRTAELPDEDTQLEHYLFADGLLHEAGFIHYEISNFARAGFESRHNLAYWDRRSYLGLGPSAHSFFKAEKIRQKNFSDLSKYQASLSPGRSAIEWQETLSPEQEKTETLMLGLRTNSGISRQSLSARQHGIMGELQDQGLAEGSRGQFRLTPKGWALHDGIMHRLV